MKFLSFILFFILSITAKAQDMQTPKEECENLMNEILPFAEKMLREHGEFLPFGGKMITSGEVVHVGASDGREQPPSIDLIKLLRQGFANEAKESKLKATAIVYDVRITPPGMNKKMDAIQIDLNHRDGYSVSVIFPYILKDGQIEYGDVFASRLELSPFKN
ncbi:hypothetical protein P3T73_07005 [Kiritimatiellota bacterium B12222]|nr:hypothetical protein P3T73_07005 [Kiritimatiellota bacterium B12222]